MPYYWAEFEKTDRHILRFDTRIYLGEVSVPKSDDVCVGAVVGKNPGSAKASRLKFSGLQPILLAGDKLLPTVRNIILKAYEYEGKASGQSTYIQVLNLFYLCNPKLSEAIKENSTIKNSKICRSESRTFPWIWYVWGGKDKRLSKYKLRFENINADYEFFYDKNSGTIKGKIPSVDDFAKHTQGLRHEIIVPYIATFL